MSSQFAGYILGLTFLTLGVFALTVYFSDIRGERWTLVAMALSILGIGLLLSRYGLRTYAVLALEGAYLDGADNAVELANVIFADSKRLLRGLLILLGGLHPLRFRGLGLRGVAQMGRGALGPPRPASLRASAGPVFGSGGAAASGWRVGDVRRFA